MLSIFQGFGRVDDVLELQKFYLLSKIFEPLAWFQCIVRNTAAVCGVLPHGCEQAFGSLWQFGALAKAPSQNANRPIGVRIVLKYRLNKAYTNVNQHVMMYLLCCLMYNTTHKKFPIKYATEEGQMFIFDQIKLLLPITFV